MKKAILYAVAGLCLPTVLSADPIGVERAQQIASAFVKKEGSVPRLVKSARRVKSKAQTANGQDAPVYVYSRGENQGFVIVSGDDCLPEVLGYTDSGDFVESQMPPALLDMIEGYRELVESAQEQGAPARVQQRAATKKADITPLIKTHWHQNSPYNDMSPWRNDGGGRAVTGCVATAAAQVAYYWWKDLPKVSGADTPTYGYGDAPVTESIAKGAPYQWDLMQMSYSGSYPAEMSTAVARLMYIVGTSTWLTYGSSTSGQISNLVNTFSSQFSMSSTCWYKSGNSEAYWEGIIYDDLALGRPIVYSGVHSTNGGHAIVLDGYRASDNKFHFNFGWGGQGDGYYTLDDNTGVNGFASQQGMTFRITPRVLNYSATIEAGEFLQRTDNNIRVTFVNNSTVDYKGVYLFCLTGSSTPSSIDKATRKDDVTVIPSGESRSLDFSFRASVAGTYNLYVTDRNMRILHKMSVQSRQSLADLTLEGMAVEAASAGEERVEVDGEPQTLNVQHVYNNTVEVKASLYNGEAATYCEPTMKCELYAYDKEAKAFVSQSSHTVSNAGFPTGKTSKAVFSFTGLKADCLYKARLNPSVTAGRTSLVTIGTPDSVVYFRALGADLAVTNASADEIRLVGHWNTAVFAGLAKDSTVSCYDLTAVEGISTVPSAANRNALFYMAPDAAVTGRNIVKDGVCDELVLTAGYNFQPKEDFRALQATLFHGRPATLWSMLVLPFDCQVPQGIMARKINKLRMVAIYECDSVNTVMKGGTPYQCMIGDALADRFTAQNVTVSVNTPSECTDSVRGTFVNKIATDKEYLLDEGDVQYFVESKGALIPAFTGYLPYAKRVSSQSTPYRDKDRSTKNLAIALNAACVAREAYRDVVSEEVYETFCEVIDRAEKVLTNQPQNSSLLAMTEELKEATEACKVSVPPVMVDGMEDKTGSLVNPSFEQGNIQGWKVENTAAGVQSAVSRPASSLANFMVGADGNCVFYTHSSSGNGADVVQTVSGLPDGTYQIRALFATAADGKALLVGNDASVEVTGSAFGPMYFEEVVLDDVTVTGGMLTLGIRSQGSWYKADNFRLYCKDNTTPVQEVGAASDAPVVHGGNGCITVTASVPITVTVHAANGALVARRVVSGTETIGGLGRGLYIVNRQKILVR